MSRLLDLCRQCIVFDCVRDLFDCLRAIEADPEVLLLRIKNRMDPAYDAQQSGGYRDVSLNLRIVSALTSSYAVDAHVCEVQLILRQFAEVKVRSSWLVCLLTCSVGDGACLSALDWNPLTLLDYVCNTLLPTHCFLI